ncbi:MAG: GTP pyrophosphokinase family protein [Clostridia bacterium]
MLKEATNSIYYDFYRENLLYLEAVIEKMLDRISEIEKKRELNGQRKLSDNVRYRIKNPESMKAKLEKKGFPATGESAIINVNDAAGIRIICPYIDDVYTMAEKLSAHSDIEVCEVKDYIKNPKENGYRSYHLIIRTPIVYKGETHFVKCEIQIRSMVMNSWASAEHQLRYKNNDLSDAKQIELLKKCADEMLKIDYSMMRIRDMMENNDVLELSE